MQVTAAMLADAATVERGKLYIHGGGWDSITARAFPVVHASLALAFILRVEYDEALDDIPILVDLVDEDDGAAGVQIEGVINAGHPPGTRRGSPSFVPYAITFTMLEFETPRAYRFRILTKGRELASVAFRVNEPRPG